jgi:hypothetical protein
MFIFSGTDHGHNTLACCKVQLLIELVDVFLHSKLLDRAAVEQRVVAIAKFNQMHDDSYK